MTFIIIAISYIAVTSMILGIFRGMRDRNMPEAEYYSQEPEKSSPVFTYSESSSNKKLKKMRYA